MVKITTLGGSGKARMASSVHLALSTGICTCMTTASGEELAGQPQAVFVVWDLGDDLHAPVGGEHPREALAEHGVVVCQQHPDRPVLVPALSHWSPLRFVGMPRGYSTACTFRATQAPRRLPAAPLGCMIASPRDGGGARASRPVSADEMERRACEKTGR